MKLTELPENLIEFIESVCWTYAKTMPKWPHEYIVRDQVDEELFVRLGKLTPKVVLKNPF